jgi:hypothetical protein
MGASLLEDKRLVLGVVLFVENRIESTRHAVSKIAPPVIH